MALITTPGLPYSFLEVRGYSKSPKLAFQETGPKAYCPCQQSVMKEGRTKFNPQPDLPTAS